jgi:hypothetical protein
MALTPMTPALLQSKGATQKRTRPQKPQPTPTLAALASPRQR